VQTNLRAEQEPGKGFLAVLYPRKNAEAKPQYETIVGGAGVKVTSPRGTDWVFLGAESVQWEGEGLRFEGRVGGTNGRWSLPNRARSLWPAKRWWPRDPLKSGWNPDLTIDRRGGLSI